MDFKNARMWVVLTLQQLKMKVTKVTQIKSTPFKNGVPRKF